MAVGFLNKYETTWDSSSTTKTLTPTIAIGDVFAIIASDDTNTSSPFSTPSGTGLTVTSRQAITNTSLTNDLQMWTAVVTSAGTPTVTMTGPAVAWGFVMYRYSGVTGIGASVNSPANSSGNVNITTTGISSAVVLAMNDFNGSAAAPTYLTTAGTFTTESHFTVLHSGSLDAGHYADAGAIGIKNVGASAPSTSWSIIALELLTSSATLTPSLVVNKALRRSVHY